MSIEGVNITNLIGFYDNPSATYNVANELTSITSKFILVYDLNINDTIRLYFGYNLPNYVGLVVKLNDVDHNATIDDNVLIIPFKGISGLKVANTTNVTIHVFNRNNQHRIPYLSSTSLNVFRSHNRFLFNN